MKSKLTLISFLILPISLLAQFIEFNAIAFDEFSNIPTASINHINENNFKFVDFNNFNTSNNIKKLKFSIGLLTDVQSNKYAEHNENILEGKEYHYFGNDSRISPEFSIYYKINGFEFQVSNYVTTYLNPKQITGGVYSGVYLGKMIFHISNRALSFYVSKKINSNVYLSGGVLTNHYMNIFKLSEYDQEAKIQTKYFDQFQFMGSINYNINLNNELYIFYKTQKSMIKVPSTKFYFPDLPNFPQVSSSVLSYTGLLALGFQHCFHNKFKVSFEILNHFLNAEGKYQVNYQYDFKHNLWNTELETKLSYLLKKNLHFCVLYSRYLKFENEVHNYHSLQKKYNIHIPQTFSLSLFYRLNKNVDFTTSYQFSFAKTDYSDSDDQEEIYKDSSHYLKVSLSFYVF